MFYSDSLEKQENELKLDHQVVKEKQKMICAHGESDVMPLTSYRFVSEKSKQFVMCVNSVDINRISSVLQIGARQQSQSK